MIPEPAAALQTIMGTLMMEVAPNMRDEYRTANVNLIAVAAALIAQELDRAAEVRVWENGQMRAILARAAAVVPDATLRSRLVKASESTDPSLRVSELTAANSELRRLLIELHAVVEELRTPQAAEIDRAVWAFLRDASGRRAIQIG